MKSASACDGVWPSSSGNWPRSMGVASMDLIGNAGIDTLVTVLSPVKRTLLVLADHIPRQHRRDPRQRHGEQQPHISEQQRKREQREHQPYRVDTDAGPNKLGIEDITLE